MSGPDPVLRFDHIAIAATRLEDGVAWLEERLGVALAPGGQHPAMGTHNRLLSLGPDLYLEVIAIDPDAAPPGRARWFGLDRFEGPPRLQSWIVAAPPGMARPAYAGPPVALSRGDLRWSFTVLDTGALPFDGVGPPIITWEKGGHPTEKLADCGVRLTGLRVTHPRADALREALTGLQADLVEITEGPAALSVTLRTPKGEVTL
ncbi:VOC family protein [Dinoroseobacter sp. S124A]|uniref:VOC family protein n=1 Tax=Dinoroseobacter sp. S124A TaxID=3415128 RepID=UPI003C7A13D9